MDIKYIWGIHFPDVHWGMLILQSNQKNKKKKGKKIQTGITTLQFIGQYQIKQELERDI